MHHRLLATQSPEEKPEEKLGLFKRFKKMWKDYWYVMIPVHLVTSAGWGGGFYLMCKSGLDVQSILAALGTSEAYLEKISQSEYTYIALAYACYKVATPIRYTVTIGGTTYTIRHLTRMGVLKTTGELRAEAAEMSVKMKGELQSNKDQIQHRAKLTWNNLSKKSTTFQSRAKLTWDSFAKKRK